MVKKQMTNTGDYTRRWDSLQLASDLVRADKSVSPAGSTLELEPGESAEVLVPEDFEDPWLKEAKVGATKRETPKKETSTSEIQKEV